MSSCLIESISRLLFWSLRIIQVLAASHFLRTLTLLLVSWLP